LLQPLLAVRARGASKKQAAGPSGHCRGGLLIFRTGEPMEVSFGGQKTTNYVIAIALLACTLCWSLYEARRVL
jgi:hypothetical protein